MGMVWKLLSPFAVAGTLLLAGCGGHSSGSSSTPLTSHTATKAMAQITATEAHVAPARRAIAKKLRGQALTGHSSKPPNGLEDNEGPRKPRAHSALPARSYQITVTGKSSRLTTINGGSVGVVQLLPKTRQVCWEFARLPTVVVRTAAFGRVRMVLRPQTASIHAGARGATGPVVAALYGRYVAHGCAAIAPVVLNSILAAPHLYYVSLGSAISPTGVLRAQL
jgi:hypothetical protein